MAVSALLLTFGLPGHAGIIKTESAARRPRSTRALVPRPDPPMVRLGISQELVLNFTSRFPP